MINGLTDLPPLPAASPTCMTVEERRGPIAGHDGGLVGDGNNVARLWIQAPRRGSAS